MNYLQLLSGKQTLWLLSTASNSVSAPCTALTLLSTKSLITSHWLHFRIDTCFILTDLSATSDAHQPLSFSLYLIIINFCGFILHRYPSSIPTPVSWGQWIQLWISSPLFLCTMPEGSLSNEFSALYDCYSPKISLLCSNISSNPVISASHLVTCIIVFIYLEKSQALWCKFVHVQCSPKLLQIPNLVIVVSITAPVNPLVNTTLCHRPIAWTHYFYDSILSPFAGPYWLFFHGTKCKPIFTKILPG